ncbi:MAG: hypothetical protein ACE5EH_12435 [Gammaproteobacteria bacterium]
MTINMIDGNFPVDQDVLQHNITELLIASSKYDLTKDETAYVLATAFGETRFGASAPIEGAYFDDLVENISQFKAENDYGYLTEKGEALGNTQPNDGWVYRGRGFAQLTGRRNYMKMQELFGENYEVDMVSNPNVVADNSTLAAEITVYGMKNGSFTGYSFSDAQATTDFFYNSRRIINGTKSAFGYKQHALNYQNSLTTDQSSQ